MPNWTCKFVRILSIFKKIDTSVVHWTRLNIELNFSISKIDAKLIDIIFNLIKKGINLTIIAGFNLDFILNLLQNTKNKEDAKTDNNGYLKLIYSMDTKYDSAEKKITHLTSNLYFNEFILKWKIRF